MSRRALAARAGSYVLVIWAALTLNFALPRLAPGDPIQYLLGDQTSNLTPDQRRQVLARYGLDRSLAEQYRSYLGGVATGDLGLSVRFGRPVTHVLAERLPWTFLLVSVAAVISLLVSVAIGVLAASRRHSRWDTALITGALSVDAIPAFWIGMVLIAAFAVTLGWLPSFGAAPMDVGGLASVLGIGQRLVLPVATLVAATVGSSALLVRGSMMMTLDEAYILQARAKGLSRRRVILRHALRNALLPISTNFTLHLGTLLSRTVVVETVFAYPGLGRLIYEATLTRDYPVLQGALVLVAVSVIGVNLLADLTYPLIDPRVRAAA